MTKKEIARFVYDNTQLNSSDSQAAVQSTFDAIVKLLVKFGRVELRGFGVFMIQKRSGRKARNPRTGEEVWVDEHETVVFKPSKLMKAEIQTKRAAAAKKTKKTAKPAAKASAKATAKPAPAKSATKAAAKKPATATKPTAAKKPATKTAAAKKSGKKTR